MPRARILIENKPGVFDPESAVVASSLKRLGYADVRGVSSGRVIEVDFDDSLDDAELDEQIERICTQFLVNPVLERYRWERIEEGS